MKFTNVKQLIIKFMGGGLINFPTRFLRWVKINGDTDSSDDSDDDSDGGESGGNSDIFFKPASIQPKYIIKMDPNNPEATPELVNIEDFTLEGENNILVYNKEDIVSLGINESDLNSLTPIPLQNLLSGIMDLSNSLQINNDIAENNIIFYIIGYVPHQAINSNALIMIRLTDSYNQTLNNIYLYKIENDNMFMFFQQSSQTPVN